MRFLKFAVVCVAALAICGCEQGQPTPPAPTPDKQATTAVSAPDFAATKKDAESGDAEAQFRLGGLYDTGRGVPQDDAEAMKWYRLAADQGHAMAQHNLGGMYHLGQGVPQDYAEVIADDAVVLVAPVDRPHSDAVEDDREDRRIGGGDQ